MRAIRVARAVTCIAYASALCISAPASSASADYYLKIKDLPGETKDDKHKNEIEILSWSWGASQTSASGLGGGMGAGKANVQDISLTSAPTPAKVSKVESIAIKQTAAKANDRLRSAGPKDGWPAAKPAKTTPPSVTLKRGVSAAAAGGVHVAAGDVDGDGAAASGLPTGKRQHKPLMMGTGGSVTLTGSFAGCRVGDVYPELELGGRGSPTYRVTDAIITSCGDVAAGGDRPTESISFNFTKVE